MSTVDVGRTNFQDGMRVAREHLEHLQEVLRSAAEVSRQSAGLGKVCFGLQVTASGPSKVSISAGAAFDRAARVLSAEQQDIALSWGANTTLHLVLRHTLGSDPKSIFHGEPTIYFDQTTVDVRDDAPPYADDGVVFARLDLGADSVTVTQLGAWYLPPSSHAHSGRFAVRDGLWRYDGDMLGYPQAQFDSGFVTVPPGGSVALTHTLASADLLVTLQARRKDGVITSAGLGTSCWHELAHPDEIRLVRAAGPADGLQLRALIWVLGAAASGPSKPLAAVSADVVVVAPGKSFQLDASASRAFGDKQIKQYIWTLTN